jgi:hypothetical protein
VRDFTIVKDDEDEVVELLWECPRKRMTGRLRLDPRRKWAVREYEEVSQTHDNRETVETFRYSYRSDSGDMPVLRTLVLTRRKPTSTYEEMTEIIRVSVNPLDAKTFMKEGLTDLQFPQL